MINVSSGNPVRDSSKSTTPNEPAIPNKPVAPDAPINQNPSFPTHNPASQNKTFMSNTILTQKTPTPIQAPPKPVVNTTTPSTPKIPLKTNEENSSDSKKIKPKKKFNLKIITGIIILILIIIGSIIGFYLTQQTQDLRQQASESEVDTAQIFTPPTIQPTPVATPTPTPTLIPTTIPTKTPSTPETKQLAYAQDSKESFSTQSGSLIASGSNATESSSIIADNNATPSATAITASDSANLELPEILPETGPEDWLNWLKAGLVTLGVGTALFLLL